MPKIDLKLRKEIYERDKYTCQICGSKVILTKDIKTNGDYSLEASLDHIIPESKKGKTTIDNLRTVCRGCNSRKKDRTNEDELKFLNLNNGNFTRIHNSILLALARIKLNTQESRIIMAIFIKTYGFQKSEDWVSNGQLEEITGIHKSHCANTVTRLKKRNIVTKTGNKIKFNKYFFNWIELPKQVTKQVIVPKQVTRVTQTGTQVLPKQVHTKENIQKKYTKEIVQPTADDYKSANLLKTLIQENLPTFKEPNIDNWASDIDKLHRIDKYTYEQIDFIIRWCQNDDFWRGNILSPAKLRKQFITLIAQAQRVKKGGTIIIKDTTK